MHESFDGEFAAKVPHRPLRVDADGRDPGRRPVQQGLTEPFPGRTRGRAERIPVAQEQTTFRTGFTR